MGVVYVQQLIFKNVEAMYSLKCACIVGLSFFIFFDHPKYFFVISLPYFFTALSNKARSLYSEK